MDCLVTKLKGNVSDDSLLKMGEFRAYFQPKEGGVDKTKIQFTVNGDVTVSVIGSGTLSDSEEGEYKDSITIKGTDGSKLLYFTDDVKEISVLNKYAVTSMYISSDWNCKNDFYIKDLNQAFDYSKLSILKVQFGVKKLVSLDIERLDLSSCTIILLGNNDELSLVKNNIADNIHGEITKVNESITNFSICGTNVKFNLSLLNGKNIVPNIMYSGVYGDVGNLAQVSSKFRMNLYGTKGLYGDLSKITKCYLVVNDASDIDSNSFTWSNKGDRTEKMILQNITITSGLDQYLIDMTTLSNPSDTQVKNIIIKGARTSASDSAVQTLQSQGYTIQVIDE